MTRLVVLPFVVPLFTAAFLMIVWARRPWRQIGFMLGASLHVVVSFALLSAVIQRGTVATQLGGWPPPFGITFVADPWSACMLSALAVVGWCGAMFSIGSIAEPLVRRGYLPLYMALLAGVSGATLVGDVFSLYVTVEIMLTASFVLLGMGGHRVQMEGTFKYMVLNLVGSLLLLTAIGLLYRATGTLNMAELAERGAALSDAEVLLPIAMLCFAAFGVKSALFPLFFWLPASYHTPPVVVSAVFAGMLTKVGVYILIRLFTTVFRIDLPWLRELVLALAASTMVVGVLGAIVQRDVRRILSVHIISQIGYMIMGLGLYSVVGIGGAIYFTIHNVIVKTNLFLVGGLVRRLHGSYHLDALGGVYARHGWLSALFLFPAFSLAGAPPLSGFVGKLALVEAAVSAGAYTMAGVSLWVGLWTLYSMTKIWKQAFWEPPPDAPITGGDDGERRDAPLGLLITPCVVLTVVSVGMGVLAGPVMDVCLRAAQELFDRRDYVTAVLGGVTS